MRSRRLSFLRAERAALALVAVALAAGCSGGTTTTEAVAEPAGFAAPDRVVAGPQGTVGQFVVECAFDRFQADDPIVHPNDVGGSHLHQFFGAVAVTADSTDSELRTGTTTCDQSADTASYWAPALIGADGTPIEPVKAVAYYRAGPGVDPATVVPYPPGFMVVAGDPTSIDPQPTSVVAFACGVGNARVSEPLSCGGAPLRMVVTFQDCWDGVHTRSPVVPEPDLHVSYSRGGQCPDSHPVPIPQLQLAIDYPSVADADLPDLLLASGDIHTGHADFWNTWDQDKLINEVARCITRDLVCGLTS